MAARIALVDVAEGTALAVRAALGAGAVRACRRGAVPAGIALVITEGSPDAAGAATPVLVLAERGERVTGNNRFEVLEKPFDAVVLRQKIRGMLETSARHGSATSAGPDETGWLAEPLVEAAVARMLGVARRAGGPAWIIGEPGTGTDQVATALVRDGADPVLWRESEPLEAAAARLGGTRRALWVPAVERRSGADQVDLERFLATDARRTVVATSGDDPEACIAAGSLSPSLAMVLSRLSVRLAPLRERRGEIERIAEAVARDVAQRCGLGRVTFTDRAKAELQAYAWPYNLLELESVLTRTLAASSDGPAVEIDELQLAPLHLAPLPGADDEEEADGPAATAADGAAPRRAVVVALGDVVAARAAATSAAAPAAPANAPAAEEESAIESVLAGFAHDLRNPMATIKTFASLAAVQDGETAELARLAAVECNRVDEQLELLQRFSEIEPAEPEDVELVEILVDAVDAADATYVLAINARRALKVRCDAALARFVADAIVGECRARLAPGAKSGDATADVDAASGALTITIPTGVAAVDRLDRWVGGKRVPWRLALARDAARRAGGSLEMEAEDGVLRLSWKLSVAGDKAGTPGKPANTAGSPADADEMDAVVRKKR